MSRRDQGRTGAAAAAGDAPRPTFPRRDAKGRVASFPEMLGGVVGNVVLGTALVAAIDGLVTVAITGTFGQISGWLAGILMVWVFVEEFRAWRIGPARILVAFVAGVVGVLAGAALSARLDVLSHLFAGALGVALAGVIYAIIWFYGIRVLADRLGKE